MQLIIACPELPVVLGKKHISPVVSQQTLMDETKAQRLFTRKHFPLIYDGRLDGQALQPIPHTVPTKRVPWAFPFFPLFFGNY